MPMYRSRIRLIYAALNTIKLKTPKLIAEPTVAAYAAKMNLASFGKNCAASLLDSNAADLS
jgi:hypothetical protein